MRHAVTITEGPLAISVVLSPVVGALVPAASFATPRPIPCNPTLDAAVALAAIVSDADVERPAAVEALDPDQVDRIRPSHAAARRISDNAPCGCEALFVARQRFHLAAPTAPAACPGAVGRFHPAGAECTSPWPPTPRPRPRSPDAEPKR